MRYGWGLFWLCLCGVAGVVLVTRPTVPSAVVVFLSDRDGNAEVFRVALDGSDLRQLTHTTMGAYCSASPSPNGQLIYTVYTETTCASGPMQVGVMRLDGSHATRLQGVETRHLDTWSPDGEWAVYTDSQRRLYKIRWRTQQSQPLTTTSISDPNPVWSPNRQWVAYFDDANGDRVVDVVLVNPDSGEQRILSTQGQPVNLNVKSVWAVDSRSLYFTSASRMLYRLDIGDGSLQLVNMRTALSSVYQTQLRVVPDGQSLLYLGECGGQWGLCRVGLVEGMPLGEAVVAGAEQSAQFAVSPDGRQVVVARRDNSGHIKLYRADLVGGAEVALTTGAGHDTQPMWVAPVHRPWLGMGWLIMGVLGLGAWLWRQH